jgi:hypothetical protein
MRRFATTAAVAFVATVALVADVNAMPAFTRQTGLTCNQCHVSVSGTPDFTFTGKKFRLNAYRAPWVAEKIEAGEEGALNGRRLVLGLNNNFSVRMGQSLLAQSKPASQVGSSTAASSVSSRPYSNYAFFYVGAIGDHIGFWNEIYMTTGGGSNVETNAATIFRTMGMDEWSLKIAFNPGYDNIVGFATTTQSFQSLSGFSPFSSGAAGNQMQRGGVAQAHAPYGNLAAYALLKDRFLVVLGVQGGEDNYDLSGMAYQANLGVAISNSDYNQLWYMFMVKAGNDAIPIVTNVGLSADRSSFTYSDAYTGVSATRGNTAATRVAYRPADVGDFVRTYQELQYSFVDRGPWSLMSACGFTYNKETYADGAGISQSGVGCNIRFYYNRTYGIQYGKSKFLKNEFTDKNGVVHEISDAPINPFSGTFYYRPAMNVIVSLGWGFMNPGGGNRLDDTRQFNKDGWNWSLGLDINW